VKSTSLSTSVVSRAMPAKTKRKWRWSSKSLFASGAPNKILKIEHPIISTQDGTTDQRLPDDASLEGYGLGDSQSRIGVAARMRRSGSKLLSIVGLQRNDGNDQLAWATRAVLTKARS